MSKLLKLQLRNLFRLKSFYICTLLTFLLSPFITYLISYGTSKTAAFPEIISFLESELGIVTVIFITLFTCFDFSEETTKNIIARGYTRKQLFLSKYIISLFAVFLMDLMVSFVVFILYIKGGIGFETSMIYNLIGYFFTVLAQTAVFVSLAFIIQKTGGAIIANIFIPMFVPLILMFVEAKFKLNVSDYWFDQIYTIASKKGADLTNIGQSALLALIYILVFVILGIFVSKNREVK